MFSRKEEDPLKRVKETAQQGLEDERERLERERELLATERAQLEKLRAELEAKEEHLEELEDQLEDLEDELDDHEEELEDAESVRELLEIMSEGIPSLMRGINDAMYTPEAMKRVATAISTYYQTLIDAGMDKEMAERLTTVQASQMSRMVSGHTIRPGRPAPPPPPPIDASQWKAQFEKDFPEKGD